MLKKGRREGGGERKGEKGGGGIEVKLKILGRIPAHHY